MRFGLNLLLWADVLTDEALPLLDEVKEIGYDTVELPVFEIDVKKYAKWGKRMDEVGLSRTGTVVRGVADNPMSPDPKIRRAGIDANKAALECCQAAGIETMAGPFHSALGYFSGAGPTKDEWNWAVESMREVAEYAEKCNVVLGLEYLNRFECYLLNTAADGARFCRDVNSVTVSPKFQVVIPLAVRERMNIRPGERLEVISLDDCIELVPIRPMQEMKGFLKGFDPGFQRDEDDR